MPWPKWKNRRQIGDEKELQAKLFLKQQGLQIIEQNYLCRYGEIDLICLDERLNILVLVEVRYRGSQQFGGAAASVTPSKQAKLKKAALFYLATRKLDIQVRFDVIAIEQQQLNWIQSAFS